MYFNQKSIRGGSESIKMYLHSGDRETSIGAGCEGEEIHLRGQETQPLDYLFNTHSTLTA